MEINNFYRKINPVGKFAQKNVDFPSLEVPKTRLDGLGMTWDSGRCPLPMDLDDSTQTIPEFQDKSEESVPRPVSLTP